MNIAWKLLIAFIILIVIIRVIRAVAMKGNAKRIATQMKEIDEVFDTTPGFAKSVRYIGIDGLCGIAIDEKKCKLCFVTVDPEKIDGSVKYFVLNAADIEKSSIIEDGDEVAASARQTDTGARVESGVVRTPDDQGIAKRIDLSVLAMIPEDCVFKICFMDATSMKIGRAHV